MKKTLTVLALSALAIGMSVASYAQTPGPSGGQGTLHAGKGHANREHMMQEILAKLNLSPSQKDQIKALMKQHQDQMKELHKSDKGNTDKTALRAQMKTLNENFHKQLFTILTPAQQQQFKAEMQELRKKWQQEHPNAGGAGAGKGKA